MINQQMREDYPEPNPSSSVEKSTSNTNDPLWTVDEVAGYLQLQPETIRSMARRGDIPAIKLGKVWRFDKYAIHDMMCYKG